jgi:histidyl-tRNA synthetase
MNPFAGRNGDHMPDFQRPRGTRDFTPDQMKIRRWAESRMRDTIRSRGYFEIATPTFENTELFVAKSGPQVMDQIYEFKDKGGRSLSLRPELTAPVMRFYHSDLRSLPKPLRISYFGNCFRYERPQKGRYREFWQMGIEFIGKRTPLALAEVVEAAISALKSVGLKDFIVRIGHVSILKSILKSQGVDADRDDLMVAIDKKDTDAIDSIITGSYYCDPSELIELVTSTYGQDGYNEILDRLGEDFSDIAIHTSELSRVLELLEEMEVNILLDPSISRGLDYYDGLVFEIDSPNLGAEKQICGGGAYSLSSVFGTEVEGIGFGLGFDRILVALGDEGVKIPSRKKVYLIPIGDPAEKMAMEISSMIRSKGIICLTETSGRGFKKAINSAINQGCSHLLVLGDDEIERGVVSVKDLSSKNQIEISLEGIKSWIHGILEEK